MEHQHVKKNGRARGHGGLFSHMCLVKSQQVVWCLPFCSAICNSKTTHCHGQNLSSAIWNPVRKHLKQIQASSSDHLIALLGRGHPKYATSLQPPHFHRRSGAMSITVNLKSCVRTPNHSMGLVTRRAPFGKERMTQQTTHFDVYWLCEMSAMLTVENSVSKSHCGQFGWVKAKWSDSILSNLLTNTHAYIEWWIVRLTQIIPSMAGGFTI